LRYAFGLQEDLRDGKAADEYSLVDFLIPVECVLVHEPAVEVGWKSTRG
jgi:hypothetical protein